MARWEEAADVQVREAREREREREVEVEGGGRRSNASRERVRENNSEVKTGHLGGLEIVTFVTLDMRINTQECTRRLGTIYGSPAIFTSQSARLRPSPASNSGLPL